MSKPDLVILALEEEKRVRRGMYFASLLQFLESKANVRFITEPVEASTLFRDDGCPVVLVVDQALTLDKYAVQKDEAKGYVNSGGTIIFAGLFARSVTKEKMTQFFAHFSLPWTAEDSPDNSSTFLNEKRAAIATTGLSSFCGPRAVYLANVELGNTIYYGSTDRSAAVTSRQGPPPDESRLAVVAFARVNQGKVGYVGYLHDQPSLNPVIMAMCSLSV